MPKNKSSQVLPDDEVIDESIYDDDDDGDDDDSDDLSYYGTPNDGGEEVTHSVTTEAFFKTEETLYALEKHFRGYQKINGKWVYKNKPIARDEFINQIMNSLRSILNPGNMISNMDADDLAFVLLEKNTEIIYAALEEATLDEDDYEYVVNVCDHTMQLFVGHLVRGHGSKVARQMSANIYHDEQVREKKSKSFLDEILTIKEE